MTGLETSDSRSLGFGMFQSRFIQAATLPKQVSSRHIPSPSLATLVWSFGVHRAAIGSLSQIGTRVPECQPHPTEVMMACQKNGQMAACTYGGFHLARESQALLQSIVDSKSTPKV